MANLRAVLQDQEPWRLVDEDPDQHSHPLFRKSPGMKMLGARGRERIKRYRIRNERFPRNEILYFHEIIQTPFQKVETDTNPPTEPTHGRETDGRRQTRKPGPRTRKQGGDCRPHAPTPENDGASKRSGLARRLPAPRSQKRPGDQTGAVKPERGRTPTKPG